MNKKIMALLMAASMLVSLTACGGNAPAGNTQTPPSEGSAPAPSQLPAQTPAAGVPVKVAVSTYTMDWVKEVYDAYMKENPDANVEIIEIQGGADMAVKTTMMMKSEETCPDLVAEDGFMVKADAAAGYLSPLDDRLAQWDDFTNFMPAVLEGGKGVDGKQYGLPYSTDVQGIWYNKGMMAKAGVTLPFEPKSWNDIIEAAKKMKTAAADKDFIPMSMFCSKAQGEATSHRTFQNLYFGTGGELYSDADGKWVVDKTNLKKVADFVDTVYNKEKLAGSMGVATAPNLSDLMKSDHMKNNKVGIFISADGTIGEYSKTGKYAWPEALDHWGFASLPTYDGSAPGKTTISGGWTWVIPEKAANKDGAMDFLKFIANKENQAKHCVRYNVLAVRNDVKVDPIYTTREISVVNDATAMLEFTHFRPTVEGYPSVSALYTELVENVATGIMSPDDAINSFEQELKRTAGGNNVIVK